MTEPPDVTIVTPCLDPGTRLLACLDSVAAQTGVTVEHVVVDGGSRDGTVELLRSRPDLRWSSGPDSGQADAINQGVAVARGRYVGWLNADDVLAEGALAAAVGAVEARSDAGWVYGDLEVVDASGGRMTWRAKPDVGLASFDEPNPIPQPGSLVARWAWDRVGPLDPGLQLVMDVDLWLRLLLAGIAPVHVPRVLATFEVHPGSKTGSVDRAVWVRELVEVYERHGLVRQAESARRRARREPTVQAMNEDLRARRFDEAATLARAALAGDDWSQRERLGLAVTARWPRLSRRVKEWRGRAW